MSSGVDCRQGSPQWMYVNAFDVRMEVRTPGFKAGCQRNRLAPESEVAIVGESYAKL